MCISLFFCPLNKTNSIAICSEHSPKDLSLIDTQIENSQNSMKNSENKLSTVNKSRNIAWKIFKAIAAISAIVLVSCLALPAAGLITLSTAVIALPVTPALHSPLMSVTNAISSVIIVGAILAAGSESLGVSKIFGLIAVVLASVNIFGGFVPEWFLNTKKDLLECSIADNNKKVELLQNLKKELNNPLSPFKKELLGDEEIKSFKVTTLITKYKEYTKNRNNNDVT